MKKVWRDGEWWYESMGIACNYDWTAYADWIDPPPEYPIAEAIEIMISRQPKNRIKEVILCTNPDTESQWMYDMFKVDKYAENA